MGMLDEISLYYCGVVIAFLAVIAGILWESKILKKAKETPPG